MPPLAKDALLERLLQGIEAAGWRAQVRTRTHPFELTVLDDHARRELRVYIWNITHGGGEARPEDEYRIQLTGVRPPLRVTPGVTTLLLGWSENAYVFAGLDAAAATIAGPQPESVRIPARQVAATLFCGWGFGFSIRSGTTVTVRPEFLVSYALLRHDLHAGGPRVAARRQATLLRTAAEVEAVPVPGVLKCHATAA